MIIYQLFRGEKQVFTYFEVILLIKDFISVNKLEPSWQKPSLISNSQLDRKIKEWLLFPGSLTARLRKFAQLNDQKFSIKLLTENFEQIKLHSIEYQFIKSRLAYSRQIQIYLGNTLIMYARSVVPENVIPQFKNDFRRLGEKPLGELLFNIKGIRRSPFLLSKTYPYMPAYQCAVPETNQELKSIWARCSLFSVTAPLLCLTEYFSPSFFLLMTDQSE